MISSTFSGRARTIVGRTDIANVNRAAQAGYNYRLLECCFISNADDIAKFNRSIDTLAKNILRCFDIDLVTSKKYVDIKVEVLQKGSKGKAVTALQTLLVGSGYGSFKPDASFGALTEKAVRDFQAKNGLKIDGAAGIKTWNTLLGN
jgi:murein L,D-transpeptidase YcbB/YkuD